MKNEAFLAKFWGNGRLPGVCYWLNLAPYG